MIILTHTEKTEYVDYIRWKADLFKKRSGWLNLAEISRKLNLMWATVVIFFAADIMLFIMLGAIGFPKTTVAIIAIVIEVIGVYIWYRAYTWFLACEKYAKMTSQLTLAHHTLQDYFDQIIFERLACYTGHKGYYGIAILNMLSLKENKKSRIVVANYYGENTLHPFVEFKIGLSWWALDPLDETYALKRRFKHNLVYGIKNRREYDYDTFWRNYTLKRFNQAMRNWTGTDSAAEDFNLFYQLDNIGREIYGDGTKPAVINQPVTQEVIEDFFNNPYRLCPKHKTYIGAQKSQKSQKNQKNRTKSQKARP